MLNWTNGCRRFMQRIEAAAYAGITDYAALVMATLAMVAVFLGAALMTFLAPGMLVTAAKWTGWTGFAVFSLLFLMLAPYIFYRGLFTFFSLGGCLCVLLWWISATIMFFDMTTDQIILFIMGLVFLYTGSHIWTENTFAQEIPEADEEESDDNEVIVVAKSEDKLADY